MDLMFDAGRTEEQGKRYRVRTGKVRRPAGTTARPGTGRARHKRAIGRAQTGTGTDGQAQAGAAASQPGTQHKAQDLRGVRK